MISQQKYLTTVIRSVFDHIRVRSCRLLVGFRNVWLASDLK